MHRSREEIIFYFGVSYRENNSVVCVRAYVRACVNAFVFVCVCVRARAREHACAHVHVLLCARACVHTNSVNRI